MRPLGLNRYILVCSVALNVVLLIAFSKSKWPPKTYGRRGTIAQGARNTNLEAGTQSSVDDDRDKSAEDFSLRAEVTQPLLEEAPTTRTTVSRKCPENNTELVGVSDVNILLSERNYWDESHIEMPEGNPNESTFLGPSLTMEHIQTEYIFSVPELCQPSYTVAFIIPFRAREFHLRILLGNLVPILRRQLIRYSIFVVEQAGNGTFNKGRLMNTAFEFALKAAKNSNLTYDCFVFHDVDLLSEDDTLLYRCPEGNKVGHLSTTIDIYEYRRMCCGITVGGVLATKEEEFRKVNGFPMSYWGWGGEDDDMSRRIRSKEIEVVRPPVPKGRFRMIPHKGDHENPKNPHRHKLLAGAVHRMETDGLKSLDTKITRLEKYPLFTKLLVDVGKPPS